MSDKTPDMSWPQIGCLWFVAAVLLGATYWGLGCGRSENPPSAEAIRAAEERKAKADQLSADLKHPKVSAAFHAGYAFGSQHKQTGLSKLTERELDGYAVAACQELSVPNNLRGYAVSQFKAGYGWGFWYTQ